MSSRDIHVALSDNSLTISFTPFIMDQAQTQENQSPSPSSLPSVGSFYHVYWEDESWHVAEIIQYRVDPETQENQVYVHYKECK